MAKKIVANILDALRRIGSPTQKSALQRQDEQLQGMEVLERKQRRIRDALGESVGFVATTTAIEETVVPLTPEEVRPIEENAGLAAQFISSFHTLGAPEWGLPELDAAFGKWLGSEDKLGYTDEAVVEILGAGFGQYCVTQLNMRWVRVTDKYGTALAVQGNDRDVRGFPYDTISKRLASSEHGFFLPVFISLKHSLASDEYRATPAD